MHDLNVSIIIQQLFLWNAFLRTFLRCALIYFLVKNFCGDITSLIQWQVMVQIESLCCFFHSCNTMTSRYMAFLCFATTWFFSMGFYKVFKGAKSATKQDWITFHSAVVNSFNEGRLKTFTWSNLPQNIISI